MSVSNINSIRKISIFYEETMGSHVPNLAHGYIPTSMKLCLIESQKYDFLT